MNTINAGNSVLYLWGGVINPSIEEAVNSLRTISGVTVKVENIDRISAHSHAPSTFDVVLAKEIAPDAPLLAIVLKVLKPQGKIIISSAANSGSNSLEDVLLFAGFKNPSKSLDGDITAEKPNYEIGSSAKLSFAKASVDKVKVAAVWKIDNDDDEIIDADELLDEDDLATPDPASLRVCGTTGKRKACKDCSCGLAEELSTESGVTNTKPVAASSCGSCYLGDAFRCASCPYLGMPAFKPGEKIQLSDNLLKADA